MYGSPFFRAEYSGPRLYRVSVSIVIFLFALMEIEVKTNKKPLEVSIKNEKYVMDMQIAWKK